MNSRVVGSRAPPKYDNEPPPVRGLAVKRKAFGQEKLLQNGAARSPMPSSNRVEVVRILPRSK